jgi:hypothetical protein
LLLEWFIKVEGQKSSRWEDIGFRFGDKGAHTSRTMMLEELKEVLQACESDAKRVDYVAAIVEANCCRKLTSATRRATLQRLSEMYGLSEDVPLFQIFRRLWYAAGDEQPLLALLLALSRDPLLRCTSNSVMALKETDVMPRKSAFNSLNETFGIRLNEAVLDKVLRNAMSSWTQSGHLEGRVFKARRKASAGPYTATFALLLSFLAGYRGSSMLTSPWALLLDRAPAEIENLAVDSKKRELIDLNAGGGLFDISFNRLLTESERKRIRESH